jgi:exonuclease VII small subunit
MGQYYEGLGVLNKKTAMADSINVDTMIRWNEYMYEAHREATRRTVARRSANSERVRTMRREILKTLQENPSARDIENGNALNAALTQLTDPKISSSVLRLATSPIEASVVREIPFLNASEAVTIVLSQVKAVTKWPAVLADERFAAERKAFEEIVDKAEQEDEEGDISADTLKRAHELVRGLRDKLAAMPVEGAKAQQDVSRFLKTLAGLVRMLERPDTNEAFDQLRMVKSTSLGNLIAFMEVYNLRFGAATTPGQRLLYRQLFPVLDDLRDRVVKGAGLDDESTVLANPGPVGDFFSKFDVDQSEAKAPK